MLGILCHLGQVVKSVIIDGDCDQHSCSSKPT